jgi:hypothetical protein
LKVTRTLLVHSYNERAVLAATRTNVALLGRPGVILVLLGVCHGMTVIG